MPLRVVRPGSMDAAVAALAGDDGARFLGGGTLLVRGRNSGDTSIAALLLSDGLGLDSIRITDRRVELGAAVTMAGVLARRELGFLHPIAREIGGPAVRAMATVGGNLFARSPYGDFAVALLALDAEVMTADATGVRSTPIEAFLKDRDAMRARVVKNVTFALPPAGALRFAKVTRRHPHGASVLAIAALLPIVDGKAKGVRIAYGAMAPTPIRARAVEKALEGKPLDAAAIDAALLFATEGTEPPTDPFASAWYRANVLPVHLARLLKRWAER